MRKRAVSAVSFLAILASSACGGSTPTAPTVIYVPIAGLSSPGNAVSTATAPAPIARLIVQVDNSGSTTAILVYSQILFDASASEGSNLTYSLDFGDGESTTERIVRHACQKPGEPLTSRLTVTDAFGRTSSSISRYPCVGLVHSQGRLYSLTYGWTNSIFNQLMRRSEFRRLGFEAQNGASVSGFYTHPEGNTSHFSGTLTGDRSITVKLDDGTITFTGDVLLRDTFGETGGYTYNRNLLLTMRGGSADGQTLRFTFYDPF